MVDPFGFSSYPDVYYSINELVLQPSWNNLGSLAFNVIGALPLIGKVSIPFKAAKTAKLLHRIGTAGRFVKGSERVYRVNRAVDTFPEFIPGVRKLAEKTQDFTTKYITDPIFKKYASKNKLVRTRLFRNANSAINYINASNTAADFILGNKDIYNSTGLEYVPVWILLNDLNKKK